MRRILKLLYAVIFVFLILGVSLYIILLKEDYQELENSYLQQALTHIGHVYIHKLNDYKADNGRYPDSLEELFPDYITQANLQNTYFISLTIKDKHTLGQLTKKERSNMIQSNSPKIGLWDDWAYEPDPKNEAFLLFKMYEVPGSRNTLEYYPEADDFFITCALTLIE